MSVTIAKLRGRVRNRLTTLDSRHASPDGVMIDMVIAEAWLYLASQLPAPVVATSSAFTIADGAEVFTLPVTVTSSGFGTGTTEYAGDTRIQLVSIGFFLTKITQGEMDAFKAGYAPATPPLGLPTHYSLYQDGSQIIRGRCHPASHPAQLCNLWATISAEDLRDYVGTGGAEGMDTVTIPGTREAVLALEAWTAGEILSRMSDDAAKLRGLDKSKAADWKKECGDLLYGEEQRQHSLRSTGRRQRWVA